jgi:2-polyprenyl-3-methyl-5-hydroxy-6-metoxy-1,4-benzoquinol methylase
VHDIRDLAGEALRFRDRLRDIKRSQKSFGFEWYPYDSFAAFPVLASMLQPDRRDLIALSEPGTVVDIGCGDGDLSFFFESLGCSVTAVDYPDTNFNRTLGYRTLRRALGSSVELRECDLDAGLELRGRTFGLAVCLGLLYHLKNPYGFLEVLARHARHCILSTRIAQRTPQGAGMRGEPIAYLLDPSEANADATNYWIFSEAGLRRILSRTGWDLCDEATTGVEHGSEPARNDRDQRMFCMLRSKLADPWLGGIDLEGGWHRMENASWRWTERAFSARVRPGGPMLRFRFSLPAVALNAGPIRLRASVDGAQLPWRDYATPGQHVYEHAVAPESDRAVIRFELDKAIAPSAADPRELGVQVVFWSYDEPVPGQLSPITIGE